MFEDFFQAAEGKVKFERFFIKSAPQSFIFRVIFKRVVDLFKKFIHKRLNFIDVGNFCSVNRDFYIAHNSESEVVQNSAVRNIIFFNNILHIFHAPVRNFQCLVEGGTGVLAAVAVMVKCFVRIENFFGFVKRFKLKRVVDP